MLEHPPGEGVDRIEAWSSEGLSRVQLQFDWGAELDQALDDVRAAIDRFRSRLPEDANPPTIYKFDLSSIPVGFLGVTGTGDPGGITVKKVKRRGPKTLKVTIDVAPDAVTDDFDIEVRSFHRQR